MQNIHIGTRKIIRSSGSSRIKFIKLLDLYLGTILTAIFPGSKPHTIPAKLKRILVIRPGGIGDAVFLLPILKHIRLKDPALIMDILCEERNAEIFLSQTHLKLNIYRYDTFREFVAVLNNTYDITIDTEQWHYFSAIFTFFTKSKLKIGFATRPRRIKFFNKQVPYEINSYELDNFKSLFSNFWGNLDHLQDINSCYDILSEERSWVSTQIPAQTVSIFLGASIPERRLTHEQNVALIRNTLKLNYTVALLGGRDVQSASLNIEQEITDSRIKNFVDKISLRKSAALIKQSQFFIGADSGLMHLACAVGTRTVAIFGPGNLQKWKPKGEKHTIVTENVECSPCTQFGYTVPTCNGSYHCMRKINLSRILESIPQ